MKKNEIKEGALYTNGKGRVRKVLHFGPYVLYAGQEDKDCLEYEIINDGTKNNLTKGKVDRMSRASFAAWAKQEVRDGMCLRI